LEQGDPNREVDLAWQCYQQLRSIYHAATSRGRRIAEKVIAGFPPVRSQRSPGSAEH
jgi:hypothetical protein